MLQNAYFLAKIGADTAENEQHFAEILPKTGNYPTGPPACPAARTVAAKTLPASIARAAGRANLGQPAFQIQETFGLRSFRVAESSFVWTSLTTSISYLAVDDSTYFSTAL